MFNVFDIVAYIKKNFTKKDIIIAALIIGLYFFTRLYDLNIYPIFSDEGIYIRWAKVAAYDAGQRFISLTDGRQPLQTWLTIPFLRIFPADALVSGRLFGVLGGFTSLLGMFTLTYYLFNKRIAYFASVLYIITPFYLFFDRLAMVDTWVNSGFIWMLFFSLILIRTMRLDMAILFGFVSGLFLLAKSTVSIFFGLSILAPLLRLQKNIKSTIPTIVNYGFLYVVAGFFAALLYNIQRLSPHFHFVGEKNKTFVRTIPEFFASPFEVFWHNVTHIPYYIANNLGYATFIFGLVGFYYLWRKEKLLATYLASWIILPYGAMTFFMRVLSSRYAIFMSPLFVTMAAYFLATKVKKNYVHYALILVGYSFTMYFNYTILFNPKDIPLPPVDRGQYVKDWPAGWGAKELVQFTQEKAKEKPVLIVGEGDFGMTGDVLKTFLKDGDNVEVYGVWPLNEKHIEQYKAENQKRKVYFVFAHRNEFPPQWPIRLVKQYSKPYSSEALYLFEYNDTVK